MAKPRKRKKRGDPFRTPARGREDAGGSSRGVSHAQSRTPERGPEAPGRQRPLRAARILSGLVLALGVVMLGLGAGVATGAIREGWGFPMSAVANWGRPWGAVLIVGAIAYIIGPVMIFARPRGGSIAMMIVCGLSVLLGTPLITTTTEIVYNLFQETKSRPEWVDAVWGYYMILNVSICVAVYRAYPPPLDTARSAEIP